MTTDVNKVLLAGNLVRDPALRPLGGDAKVCELRIAVNRQFTDRQGNSKDEVCFVDIDVYNNQADACAASLTKGAQVFVDGRLRLDQWEDRSTGKRLSRLKVVGDRIVFLGGRREAPAGEALADSRGPSQSADRVDTGDTRPAPAAAPAGSSGGRVWRRAGGAGAPARAADSAVHRGA
jgi:single-strand DNA-binding protein